MATKLSDILYETKDFWVRRDKGGYAVYQTGITCSTRRATIGYEGDKGFQRAKSECDKRQADLDGAAA